MREMSILLSESNARACTAATSPEHSIAPSAPSSRVSQQLWHPDAPTRVRAAAGTADIELPLLANASQRDVSLTTHAPPCRASQPTAASPLPSPRPIVTIPQCLSSPRAAALEGAGAALEGVVADVASRVAAAHAAALGGK